MGPLLTLLSMQTLICFKNGRLRLEKNNAPLFGKMMLFADILSEEDSSTGQNPGSREWTVTHGAALTLCALKKLHPALWEKHLKWPTHALPAKISGTTI